MKPPLIELRGVRRQYDATANAGVFDIDLTIDSGEYVAVVGPSGAGKSTLLQLLGMLDTPDSGSYRFAGRQVRELSERERDEVRATKIGFVFQASHMLGHLDALTNAALGMVPSAVPIRQRAERASAAMERLGIAGRARVPAGVLSGGERQRLAVARALATHPAVVLADEPTGSLDSVSGDAVLADLEQLHASGATVVIITHDERIAARAQRQIRIVDGRITEDTGTVSPRAVNRDTPGTTTTATTTLLEPAAATAPVHPPHRWRTRALDVCAEALTEVLLRGVRTSFLMLAFALGVGGLITSVGLSQTAAMQITQRLDAAAFDEVLVHLPSLAREVTVSQLRHDVSRITELPHVVGVTASVQLPVDSTGVQRLPGGTPNDPQSLQLIAVDDAYFAVNDLLPHDPTTPERFASDALSAVAVVGPDAQAQLNLPSSGAGSTLVIGGIRVDVIDTYTTGPRRPTLNNAVLVPLSLLAKLPDGQASLLVRTESGYPAALAEAIPLQLDAANPGQFTVQTVADLRNLRFGVATDLDALVGVMAGTLLVLASVSAATSMYLSVLARASEIALRRALGMPRIGVAVRFLTEGALIGVLGGAVGTLSGIIAVLIISALQGWDPTVAPWLVPAGFAIGIASGVVSAGIPALIASRQQPVAAL